MIWYKRVSFGLAANMCLLLLGCGLLIKNYGLQRDISELRAQLDRTQQAAVGQKVPDLVGFDLQNQPLKSRFAQKHINLVLVTSSSCKFYAENWINWSRILGTEIGPDSSAYIVDLPSHATLDYLKDHHAENVIFFHQLDPKLIAEYHMNITPQTILVGGDNKVKGVWTGVLTKADQEAIDGILRASN